MLQRDSKVPVFIEHVGHAAGHARREVAAGHAEHHHGAAGHVFATMVAHAFHNRGGAGVAHGETLAADTREVGFTFGGTVEHGVADDDVARRIATETGRRTHDDAATGQALAHVVVAFTHQFEGQAAGQEGAEALASRTVERICTVSSGRPA
jgi:hypothetical protein